MATKTTKKSGPSGQGDCPSQKRSLCEEKRCDQEHRYTGKGLRQGTCKAHDTRDTEDCSQVGHTRPQGRSKKTAGTCG